MSGAKLNRQPGPMNEDALSLLRDANVRRGTEVFSSDGEFLGKALKIHHRQEEIDPDLKLYAAYLEVSNLAVGSSVYVPVEFIAGYDAAAQQLNLSVSMATVMDETWDRELTFIAGAHEHIEALAA